MRNLAAACLFVSLTSVVAAQNFDAIDARQTIYKGFGKATKPIGGMLKGETPFDVTVVKAALTTYIEGSKKLPALFPDDSKTGHDTEALLSIWANKGDFTAQLNKLSADAEAALASITDKASFTATMPKVLGQCGACHKEYRAKS